MTNLFIRLFIGLILATLLIGVVLHYLKVPNDKYMPAPLLFPNATAKTVGIVTKTEDLGYTDHWWAGMDEEYYVDYTFQPTTKVQEPNGKVKTFLGPGYYSGSVRISSTDYDSWNKTLRTDPKPPIEVNYDPLNPGVNGVPDTQGLYSRSSGWFGIWIVYFIGLILVAVLIGEALKRWIKSEY